MERAGQHGAAGHIPHGFKLDFFAGQVATGEFGEVIVPPTSQSKAVAATTPWCCRSPKIRCPTTVIEDAILGEYATFLTH